MTDEDICGCTDTKTGKPCKRPSGWGRDVDGGYCKEHKGGHMHPKKLSHELQERIASDLEAGVPVKHAAPANGISRDTFHRWVKRGSDQEEGPLSDFADRVTRAREHGVGSILRDAVTIARQDRDPRTLLKAYSEIVGGSAAHDDDLAGLNLVVPKEAVKVNQDDE